MDKIIDTPEIEIIAGRKRWICTNNDRIESNGVVHKLVTRRYFKNAIYTSVPPLVSKTELNRLINLGVLSKIEKDGITVYNFCLE